MGIGDFLTQLLVFVFNFVDSPLFTLVRNPTPPGHHRCYMMLPVTVVEHPPLWDYGKGANWGPQWRLGAGLRNPGVVYGEEEEVVGI